MARIEVVGMGPGDRRYLTEEAARILLSGERVYLRTEKHPVVPVLAAEGMCYTCFDGMYEQQADFEAVYQGIVSELLAMADALDQTTMATGSERLIYGVPGNPFVAERTVELLQAQAGAHELSFIYGPSFIDATLTALRKDPSHGFAVVDALSLETAYLDTKKDLLVIQVYDNLIASEVKLALSPLFGDEHPVILVRGAGIRGEERLVTLPLYELDRTDIPDHLTSLYVPALSIGEGRYDFHDFCGIVARLRAPGGCPWDREQTHESLKLCLIEEAHEVLDAIDSGSPEALEEELGDLLLQVVFHAEIAQETGYFDMLDVSHGISRKLIQRHPHVFADTQVKDSDEVLKNWESIKREHKQESVTASMRRIPKSLPALLRAYKVQKKAAQVGFDWNEVEPALAKLNEELSELASARLHQSPVEIADEMGDVFFSLVNVCRFLGLNPEFTLEQATQKFMNRFEQVETAVEKSGKTWQAHTLEELDQYWEMAKTSSILPQK